MSRQLVVRLVIVLVLLASPGYGATITCSWDIPNTTTHLLQWGGEFTLDTGENLQNIKGWWATSSSPGAERTLVSTSGEGPNWTWWAYENLVGSGWYVGGRITYTRGIDLRTKDTDPARGPITD